MDNKIISFDKAKKQKNEIMYRQITAFMGEGTGLHRKFALKKLLNIEQGNKRIEILDHLHQELIGLTGEVIREDEIYYHIFLDIEKDKGFIDTLPVRKDSSKLI